VTTVPEIFLEDYQVDALRNLSKRLYTENRMHGDEMRDWAQTLRLIVEDIDKQNTQYPKE